jgi:hypothetical protein
MSTKIYFIVYLKAKLNHEFTKLTTAGNLQGAQNVQRFLGTNDHVHNGYFAKIEPFFEPITPKFMLTVQTLNEAVISGASSPKDFNEYALSILAALQA